MGWREGSVWIQVVIALVALGLWFLAVFVEIHFLITSFFGIVGAVVLLMVCNRSRRWGLIIGMVVYLIWIIIAYREKIICFANDAGGMLPQKLCGLGTDVVSVFGWALLPLGALVGGGIGNGKG